jgi:hypothetical protein
MDKIKKKFGLGSLSIVLALMGIVWDCSFHGYLTVGNYVINMLGLRKWSLGGLIGTGTRLTLFYSLLFFLPSFLLGNKYQDDFGAYVGKTISLVMMIISALCFLLYAPI